MVSNTSNSLDSWLTYLVTLVKVHKSDTSQLGGLLWFWRFQSRTM